MIMRAGIIIAITLLAFAAPAAAQVDMQKQEEDKELKKRYLYQWIDDKGGLHITDRLGNVPKKYRDKAVKLEQPEKDETQEQPQVQQRQPSAPIQDNEELELDRKAYWQNGMKQAKQRLADAQQHYRELEQRKLALAEARGSAATGRLVDPAELDRLDAEMKQTQQEIERARNVVEVELPDAARKAGVPPGWLRE